MSALKDGGRRYLPLDKTLVTVSFKGRRIGSVDQIADWASWAGHWSITGGDLRGVIVLAYVEPKGSETTAQAKELLLERMHGAGSAFEADCLGEVKWTPTPENDGGDLSQPQYHWHFPSVPDREGGHD